MIWWHCTNRPTNDFPSTMDDSGTYMFSGFDGAIISTLLGDKQTASDKKVPSMEDIINKAMSQEILAMIH